MCCQESGRRRCGAAEDGRQDGWHCNEMFILSSMGICTIHSGGETEENGYKRIALPVFFVFFWRRRREIVKPGMHLFR